MGGDKVLLRSYELPAHSILGASGAHRWMNCPGSVGLGVGIPNTESEFAAEGTAAHELAANCLNTQRHPESFIGHKFYGIKVDANMASAVAEFTELVKKTHMLGSARVKESQLEFIECGVEAFFHCPELHPHYHGTSDFYHRRGSTLHVWDYKHGAGIVVDVQWNPQVLYYACGVLQSKGLWDEVDGVVVHIVQPRAHSQTHSEWHIGVEPLHSWLKYTLVPAMRVAESSDATNSSEHCRFCPVVSMACPQILRDANEWERFDVEQVAQWTNDEVARFLTLGEVLKIATHRAGEVALKRLQDGEEIKGYKAVQVKSNRKWRDEVTDDLLENTFEGVKGLSPAKVDKLPGGREFTERYSYKPSNGLMVAKYSDPRRAIGQDMSKEFDKLPIAN